MAAVAVYLLLEVSDQSKRELLLKESLAQLDFYGTLTIVPGITCLILALQWGGSTYSVSLRYP
jgi:glycopeptide antibiotics resistance protein